MNISRFFWNIFHFFNEFDQLLASLEWPNETFQPIQDYLPWNDWICSDFLKKKKNSIP